MRQTREKTYSTTSAKNCVPNGYTLEKSSIFAKKITAMVLVSSREFRANQCKYFDLAKTNDVVITSRTHGNYRLVPITESDTVISEAALEAKIRKGIAEYEAGKAHRMKDGESVEEFLKRMISED